MSDEGVYYSYNSKSWHHVRGRSNQIEESNDSSYDSYTDSCLIVQCTGVVKNQKILSLFFIRDS